MAFIVTDTCSIRKLFYLGEILDRTSIKEQLDIHLTSTIVSELRYQEMYNLVELFPKRVEEDKTFVNELLKWSRNMSADIPEGKLPKKNDCIILSTAIMNFHNMITDDETLRLLHDQRASDIYDDDETPIILLSSDEIIMKFHNDGFITDDELRQYLRDLESNCESTHHKHNHFFNRFR
jgi:predicted nucleic acid-binding protein